MLILNYLKKMHQIHNYINTARLARPIRQGMVLLSGCDVHLQVGDDLFGRGTVKNFEEHKVDSGQSI